MVYLDHGATTPVHPEVTDAMIPFLRESFGNPSSLHRSGCEARNAVETARERVAALIGAQPDEIVFTGGGTEADNLAVLGAALAGRDRGNHVVTTAVEHHAVLNPCRYLERMGYEITVLPVDPRGRIDLGMLREALTERTVLVTVMHGNNEIGTLEPVAGAAALARERGIPFHTDAVQTAGKIPVDVGGLSVDFLTLSGHKLYGPKGVGALFVRRGADLAPLLHGGRHERGLRPGTENVPGIAGFGKACEIALRDLPSQREHLEELRYYLASRIEEEIGETRRNGADGAETLPHILNVSFRGLPAEKIVLELDRRGIAVSAGSACTAGTVEISHVMEAVGVPREWAAGSVRFSLGRGNTLEEMDRTVDALLEAVEKLRGIAELERSLGGRGCV